MGQCLYVLLLQFVIFFSKFMAQRFDDGLEDSLQVYTLKTLSNPPRQRDGHNCGTFVIKASIPKVF